MKYFPLIGLLASMVMACQTDPGVQSVPANKDTVSTTVSDFQASTLSNSNWHFGLSLFKTLSRSEKPGKNILISPYSIQTAMHMTANATAGDSREQMLKGLHMGDWELTELNQKHQKWHQVVINQPQHPTITSTNAFFKDPERLKENDAFNSRLNEYYNAKVMDADFGRASEAKKQINQWVKSQTQEKIEKIIEQIRQDDVGFLINALYYKADWKRPFPEARTATKAFNKANGQRAKVPFMQRDGLHLFHKGDGYMALDKPFKGDQFSLTMLMPTNNQDLKAFIADLKPGFLKQTYDKLDSGRAIVEMPKFKLAYKKDLLGELQEPLGFPLDDANISNMGESLIGGRLKITRVQHKSVLEIDEKGAEGAAVTAVGATATSMPPRLVFDEPFVVMLRHVPTNSLLFMGSIFDPAE